MSGEGGNGKHWVGVGIDREGPNVLLAMRQAGRTMTVRFNLRGARTLAASMTAATVADDDTELGFRVAGDLETRST